MPPLRRSGRASSPQWLVAGALCEWGLCMGLRSQLRQWCLEYKTRHRCLSQGLELRRAGDLPGTPKGVGRAEPGDHLEGHIDGVGDLTVAYDA